MMYGSYSHGWMFDDRVGVLVGGLWMILVFGIPLLLLAALLKYLFAKSRWDIGQKNTPEKKTPLDILQEAYARGEISREEYLQKRDDLLEKQGGTPLFNGLAAYIRYMIETGEGSVLERSDN